jgi:hypothetical protein
VIPQPQSRAAFFRAGNLYIQEGFIVGVLTYLRVHEEPQHWKTVLERLGFDRGSWEFRGRPINTGGEHGRPSRTAAINTFQHVFQQDALPPPSRNFVSYLLGDTGTTVRLVFTDGDGQLTTTDIVNQRTIPLEDVLVAGTSLRVETSPNIGTLRLTASTRTPAYWAAMTRAVRTARGFELDELANDLASQGRNGAVTLAVWYELYGGVEASAEIIFT